jgi:hypothetical protein
MMASYGMEPNVPLPRKNGGFKFYPLEDHPTNRVCVTLLSKSPKWGYHLYNVGKTWKNHHKSAIWEW